MTKLEIMIAGVGGQGSLTASTLLGRAATRAGIKVVVGEIHGMAQRGGMVTSTVRMGDVYGPIIPAGRADVLLGFEPVETWRAIGAANPQTQVITDKSGIVPASVFQSGERYPEPAEVVSRLEQVFERVIAVDATGIATGLGNPLAMSSVLLGVLAGTGLLPFDSDVLKTAIEEGVPPAAREVNAGAFTQGLEVGHELA
jgi:indolepyruvate ferredoxin oxidoreductase beta subunit